MIIGVGIDVVDVERFMATLERTPRLREKLFTVEERDLPPSSLAARFAAKEAIAKALGTGFANGIWIRDVGSVPNAQGQPQVVYSERGRKVCERGRAVCRAEAFRDYCSACGGVCGACVTQSCSTKVPCAPGSVCGVERLPTGSVRRCRSLTVPESTTGRVPCTPRAGMCWLPSEVAYEPEDEESIYNRFCAR